MNSCTQSIDIPKNKYYQETNTYPETTVYKINGIIVNKQIFYIIKQLCSQHNVSTQEIERLNNIINELEKCIVEEIDDAQEELNTILQGNDLDYKNECTKEFNCIKNALDMLLDKLKELKENNNE